MAEARAEPFGAGVQWPPSYQILGSRLAGRRAGKSRRRWMALRCPGASLIVFNNAQRGPSSSIASSTTTTMSFARALVAAGPSARLAAGRVTASRSLALASRWHSTAPRHQQVDPLVSNKPRDHLNPPPPLRSPGTKPAAFTAADEPGKDYDPYKDGPSAIDKAVHLFFFTEIIRGMCPVREHSPHNLAQ